MDLRELEKTKTHEQITYSDLLICKEWKDKRQEILLRDDYKCSKCKKMRTFKLFSGNNIMYFKLAKSEQQEKVIIPSKVPINLEVHHNYYIINNYPWEYNHEALISVCRDCHQKIHNENEIPVWSENMLNKLKFGVCSRCSGKGHIPAYNYFQNGRCFKCSGTGYDMPFEYKSRK